jgi:hypothetical protein
MKRLQKIRMLDRVYLFLMIATCLVAGLVISYNQLYFNSNQLLLQFTIVLIVGIIGLVIWRRNKV